jgi:hypothetical protein
LPHLFSREYLESYLERTKISLQREIESTNVNYILNVSENDFRDYLVQKYSFSAIVLHDANITQQQEEIRLDGSEKPTAEHATMLTGKLKVTILIPFEGNSSFFHCTPSKTPSVVPKGEVKIQHQNKMLQLICEISDRNTERIRSLFYKDIETIKQWLELVNEDLLIHNLWIKEKTNVFLSERKNQVLQNLGFAKSLGIPFTEDTNLPRTYPIPLKAETITLTKPESSRDAFQPEPSIDQANYEKILEIIAHMSLAMERSPQTFSKLSEGEIRDFFLIVLNSHFKGQVTGETFNNHGKTDILLRVEDKNAFIAECKFWRGRKSFLETIDQILSYMSWRDTKAAILVFYKGKSFSRILTTIEKTISGHRFFKRTFNLNSQRLMKDTVFSAVLHNRKDKNKELFLAILSFPILGKPSTRSIIGNA